MDAQCGYKIAEMGSIGRGVINTLGRRPRCDLKTQRTKKEVSSLSELSLVEKLSHRGITRGVACMSRC